MTPHDRLSDVARDEWSDAGTTALKAARALLELAEGSWTEEGLVAARALRQRRPDDALILAVTEAAMDPDSIRTAMALRSLIERLEDTRWSMDLAYEAARYSSLGILSLGPGTLAVLQATTEAANPELRTSSRAFRRGLLQYMVPITLVAAETADCLLLPVSARQNHRLWTSAASARAAKTALTNGRAVLAIVHPLTELSPLSRQAFRPAPHITDIVLQPAD